LTQGAAPEQRWSEATGLASIHDGLSAHADNHSGNDAQSAATINKVR
jgi:hypothetical protein